MWITTLVPLSVLGAAGALVLGFYLVVHVRKDLSSDLAAWYFHSTWMWLIVMGLASIVFAVKWNALRARGGDLRARFQELPPQ